MKKILFSAIFFLFFAKTFAQTPVFISDSLEKYIETGMKDWQIPGVAVAIIKDGKTVLMKGYGTKEMGKTDKIDENTLFMIGSNTKAYTATSLAILENEKKLSLDDKITKWLPDFKLYDACATQMATIRDMLCHRSGLETFQGDFTYWESNLTRKEVMQKFGKNKPAYDFRTRYGYCNAGFLTAGEVLSVASGRTWEDNIRERIFMPLKMTRSLALSAEAPKATNIAVPHSKFESVLTKIPYCLIDNLAPAGAISESVKDAANWLIMQMDTGKFEGKQVFPKDVIQKTWAANTIVSSRKSFLSPTQFGLYGLGWFLNDYAGKKVISHDGGVNGFVSTTCFLPEERLGIVVFTNTDANSFYTALRLQIIDAYLKQPYKNYSKILLDFDKKDQEAEAKDLKTKREQIKKNAKLAMPLLSYIGKYENEVYGEIEIKDNFGTLEILFQHHSNLTEKLESLGENKFKL